MIRNFIHYGLIVIIFGSSLLIKAQTDSKTDLRAFFVKPELDVKVGELVFDVLKLSNHGDQDIRIKPVLNLPDGFGLYTTSFHDTLVPAHDSIMLPFRIRTSNKVDATKRYKISFLAFDENNTPLIEQILYIKPQIEHNWDVLIPNNKVAFYPKKNNGEFELLVTNKGNTSEVISIDIESDNELLLTSPDGRTLSTQQNIFIEANRDTIIQFRAQYKSEANRVFDIKKVHVNAYTPEKKIYRALAIETYNDEYSPFYADYTLPNSIEGGIRTNDFAEEVTPYISAKGFTKYKNESSFQYYYSNYNLSDYNEFFEYSNYRFLYTSKGGLSAGLGAFGSQLGRNIYSRNAAMLGYSGNLSPVSKLQGFASQDFLEPITSAAFGYEFDNDKYKAFGSAAFNYNGQTKINTASIIAGAPSIPLFKNNSISVFANAYREDYSYYNKYVQQGFAWDFRYIGSIGSRFFYQLKNAFGSPNIPGNQKGLLSFGGRFTFKTFTPLNYFSSIIYDTRRRFNEYNALGEELPEVYLHDSYANILFNSNKNPNLTFNVGPSAELYESLRPMLNDQEPEIYNLQKYLIEFQSVIKKNIHLDISAGMRNIQYAGYTLIDETKPDIHITADYSKDGYGIRVNYNYGPLVTRGLYQFATDINYDGIIIAPYIMRTYGNGRVNLLAYTNLTYRFDLNYTFANIAPLAEIYLARNWYFKIRGTYTYYQQKTDEFKAQNSVYYTEIGLKKKWGKSDFYNKEKNLRRLKVICFKDENNNGKKDKLEEGIEMVKVQIVMTDEINIEKQKKSLPVNISLLTNDKGNVIFNRIPKGYYDLNVTPLGNMQEYFYVSETHEFVELTKNITYYIPFQKANKIVGKLEVEKTKYSNENPLDLENIKVTAYNQMGNSFSSFTLKDGSFTIYAPGDTTYFIRLNNIFGEKYRIVQNDIAKKVPDLNDVPVVFNIVERARKINFKKANQEQKGEAGPLKIKVLKGKIYENTDEQIQKDAGPEFDMGNTSSYELKLKIGRNYVVLAKTDTEDQALESVHNIMGKGLDAYYAYDETSKKYFVVTGEYNSAFDAQTAAQKASEAGVAVIETVFYK